jgi:phosphatidylglycerophosphatase A
MNKQISILIATGLYTGYGKPFPGTWGTIPAWLIGYFLIGGNQIWLIAVAILTFFISVWSAGESEEYFGHDSKKIVIDEWAGMFIAFLFVPISLTNYLIAFVLFRAFDVIKIYPVKQLERLPRGWGVTMDDVAAGIYANILTQIIIWIMVII